MTPSWLLQGMPWGVLIAVLAACLLGLALPPQRSQRQRLLEALATATPLALAAVWSRAATLSAFVERGLALVVLVFVLTRIFSVASRGRESVVPPGDSPLQRSNVLHLFPLGGLALSGVAGYGGVLDIPFVLVAVLPTTTGAWTPPRALFAFAVSLLPGAFALGQAAQ